MDFSSCERENQGEGAKRMSEEGTSKKKPLKRKIMSGQEGKEKNKVAKQKRTKQSVNDGASTSQESSVAANQPVQPTPPQEVGEIKSPIKGLSDSDYASAIRIFESKSVYMVEKRHLPYACPVGVNDMLYAQNVLDPAVVLS